ncbi:hypothetical protein [Streptomyces sp. WZ.A104]|uniref:hypothetical protein n=1 Tax=Streptomyces sp. WZ.A104 TaxID=2023771 RepID=UPI00269DC857
MLTTGEGVVNGLGFRATSPASLKDRKRARAIGDLLVRLERAQKRVFEHPAERAMAVPSSTGPPTPTAASSATGSPR